MLEEPTLQTILINILKWILIFLSIVSNSTLAWKIWRRKNLHTIFNLSMCFFFLWSGTFSPFLIYEYGNLLVEMIKHPETSSPDICFKIVTYRMIICQALKVFIVNILFRWIQRMSLCRFDDFFSSNYWFILPNS